MRAVTAIPTTLARKWPLGKPSGTANDTRWADSAQSDGPRDPASGSTYASEEAGLGVSDSAVASGSTTGSAGAVASGECGLSGAFIRDSRAIRTTAMVVALNHSAPAQPWASTVM